MTCCCCEATDCNNPINQAEPCFPLSCSDLCGRPCKIRCDRMCGLNSCCGDDPNCCAPIGCLDLGCGNGVCCPPRPPLSRHQPLTQPPPCTPSCQPCNPRAHHLNRSPYCCPCRPEPDPCIYRCCEGVKSSYAGHIPGFTFHSLGRNWTKASFGTKNYMDNCFYYNTWSQI